MAILITNAECGMMIEVCILSSMDFVRMPDQLGVKPFRDVSYKRDGDPNDR